MASVGDETILLSAAFNSRGVLASNCWPVVVACRGVWSMMPVPFLRMVFPMEKSVARGWDEVQGEEPAVTASLVSSLSVPAHIFAVCSAGYSASGMYRRLQRLPARALPSQATPR